MASRVSGYVTLSITTDEAPKKLLFASLAAAAIEPILEFLEVAASTLIFTISTGSGSYATPLEILGLTLFGVGLIICRSAINLSRKLCVDKGLWKIPSWIAFRECATRPTM
jgi:hypothetical protein